MSITMVLKSSQGKYLTAVDDRVSVTQDRTKLSGAEWNLEFVPNSDHIRLKSCYGKYLNATNEPFLLGMTGYKVNQTTGPDNWEPVMMSNGGFKLKSRFGDFLSANYGPPPWRNSVTHDDEGESRCLWDVYLTSDGASVSSCRPQEEEESETEKYIRETLLRLTSADTVAGFQQYAPSIATAMQSAGACTIM